MASIRVDEKRIRRTFEPTAKTWDDRALETPWEDIEPSLSKATVFAMKNVFFFSHATTVQAAVIPRLKQPSHSAVVEAPTGCGKTLAFLIPMMERIVAACDAHVAAHGRPILCRQVAGVVLSPSRVLAEQTFVVGRNLAARFPYNIDVLLCDGVTHSAASVKEHLSKASRGAGMVLISTPADFFELLRLCAADGQSSTLTVAADSDKEALLADQDEETLRRYYAKKARMEGTTKKQPLAAPNPKPTGSSLLNSFQAPNNQPLLLVVDEADVVLRADETRATLMQLLHDFVFPLHTNVTHSQEEDKKSKKKRPRDADEPKKILVDFGLFGATVGLSAHVKSFVASIGECCQTSVDHVVQRGTDFTKQLTNRHLLVPSHHMLHTLVQVLNLHPQKKHFLFFNSPAVLLFVKSLLQNLSSGKRPILFVNHIYAVYEGMKESTRFAEYNGFLQHSQSMSVVTAAVERSADEKKLQKAAVEAGNRATAAAQSIAAAKLLHERKKKALSFAEEKNQHFQGGWKRDGRPPPGTGAVLLCTDMAAFGLDVRDVDYVYHVEPPTSVRSYVHRIGRVGRMGMRGCSVLFLPWFPEGTGESVDLAANALLDPSKERKTTSARFHTITNTKLATGALQSYTVDESKLDAPRKAYVDSLKQMHDLQPHLVPPAAPISSTLRAVIEGDPSLTKMAKQAAMALCRSPPSDDLSPDAADDGQPHTAAPITSWYTPRLALETMLLD